nr:alpha/beta hydrolase family protein [bacterium]
MDFTLDAYLEGAYRRMQPRLAAERVFSGDMEQAQWREQMRAAFSRDILAVPAPVDPQPRQIEAPVDMGDYTRSRIAYKADEGLDTPAYVLMPKGWKAGDGAVVCCTGHGYGCRDIVGLNPDGSPKTGDAGYQKNFAIQVCRLGYLVIAPELAGFGDARLKENIGHDPREYACYRLSVACMMRGTTAAGLRVAQAQRAIDVLLGMGASPDRIGIMGISGGGMLTSYTALCEDRLACAVISGFANTHHDSILDDQHCLCMYTPGVLKLGELPDLLCAIAPLPMLWESATRDPLFPIDAARRARSQVARMYQTMGVTGSFQVDEFDGVHEISGRMAYSFLKQYLG